MPDMTCAHCGTPITHRETMQESAGKTYCCRNCVAMASGPKNPGHWPADLRTLRIDDRDWRLKSKTHRRESKRIAGCGLRTGPRQSSSPSLTVGLLNGVVAKSIARASVSAKITFGLTGPCDCGLLSQMSASRL